MLVKGEGRSHQGSSPEGGMRLNRGRTESEKGGELRLIGGARGSAQLLPFRGVGAKPCRPFLFYSLTKTKRSCIAMSK